MTERHMTWLFFDVGGTLLNEDRLFAYQEELILTLLNEAGCEVTEREFASAIRSARKYYLPRYASHLIYVFTEKYELYEEISKKYERITNRLSFKQYSDLVEPMPEIKDICLELKSSFRLGLIGNQPGMARKKLEREGLLDMFEVHALSAEMGMRKPDLRFYLGALAMAQCAPSEAAMIGDRLDNDIYPARTLGLTTVRLKTGPYRHQPVLSPEYLPHYTVNNTRELGALLTNSDDFVSLSTGAEFVW